MLEKLPRHATNNSTSKRPSSTIIVAASVLGLLTLCGGMSSLVDSKEANRDAHRINGAVEVHGDDDSPKYLKRLESSVKKEPSNEKARGDGGDAMRPPPPPQKQFIQSEEGLSVDDATPINKVEPTAIVAASLQEKLAHLLAKEGKQLKVVTPSDEEAAAERLRVLIRQKAEAEALLAEVMQRERKAKESAAAAAALAAAEVPDTKTNKNAPAPINPTHSSWYYKAWPTPVKAAITRGKGTHFVAPFGVPVGPGHNTSGVEEYPLWGDDYIDEATALYEKEPDGTEIPHSEKSLYDKPEDADQNCKEGSIWHELITKYRNAPIDILVQNNQTAMCLISVVYTGNCRYLEESFTECAYRVGVARLSAVLSEKCRNTDIWHDTWRKGNTFQMQATMESPSTRQKLRHGKVQESEICVASTTAPLIKPADRSIAPFGTPRQCRDGALQYPIAFGTPLSTVQERVLPKLFDFHPVPIDNPPKPFQFNDEDTYQALAALSHFCMTHSRGGWDCGRHYEVMGAGCVPYFYDIAASGPFILPQLPKKALLDIVQKPFFEDIGYVTGGLMDEYYFPPAEKKNKHVIKSNFNARARVRFVNETFRFKVDVPFEKEWYWRTARKMLSYTRKYLTTEAMAAYVLKSMGAEDAKHVLVFTPEGWDNLNQGFITGLDGLGIKMTIVQSNSDKKYAGCFRYNTTDFPESDGLPTSQAICDMRYNVGRGSLHGNGNPWANRMRGGIGTTLDDHHRFVSRIQDIWDQIEFEKLYDAAILTSFQEFGFPAGVMGLLKHAMQGKVAVLDGEDSMGDPRRNSRYLSKEVYFFSRELRRAYC